MCLKPHDTSKNCRKCHKCHHQSLCDSSISKATASDTNESSGRREPLSTDPTTANTTNSIKDKKTILLQTARAVASNSDGSKEVNLRILFDSGSQRSYITEVIKAKLGLRSLKTEKLHLNTFGDSK